MKNQDYQQEFTVTSDMQPQASQQNANEVKRNLEADAKAEREKTAQDLKYIATLCCCPCVVVFFCCRAFLCCKNYSEAEMPGNNLSEADVKLREQLEIAQYGETVEDIIERVSAENNKHNAEKTFLR